MNSDSFAPKIEMQKLSAIKQFNVVIKLLDKMLTLGT